MFAHELVLELNEGQGWRSENDYRRMYHGVVVRLCVVCMWMSRLRDGICHYGILIIIILFWKHYSHCC